MKLLDALEIINRPVSGTASCRRVVLECGFTPLHLKTFLTAHLRSNFPQNRIEIQTGLYGDLAGNLERLRPSEEAAVCVVIEWADLDPRLGIRALGGWRPADIAGIVDSARRRSEQVTHLVKRLAASAPICLATPTLPLPPLFTGRESQAHRCECELREIIASWRCALSTEERVRLVSVQRLDEISPAAERFDPKAEINSGFPYSLEHASRLAELLATLVADVSPKKGLIVDLDDTLWAGILGEIGVEGIAWDMAGHAHMHGLLQQFLGSLAGAGVLLAAASKNDPALVEQALARRDLLVPKESIFPVEANWGLKSKSVGRILKAWNIGPEDVVFLDDSAMEAAEVRAAFPLMECLIFPKSDFKGIWDLLKHLRDRFGKTTLSSEDEIRLRSVRNAAVFRDASREAGLDADSFLRAAEATISFCFKADASDRRAFELINKTNQFNLNGRRISDAEWESYFRDPAAFLLTASYEDKYGPLGKIAVVTGKVEGAGPRVTTWVMSCRAFSRRIEHQCLRHLFKKLKADEIIFEYQLTPRNGPIQDFLKELSGKTPEAGFAVAKACFDAKAPALFHRIMEIENA